MPKAHIGMAPTICHRRVSECDYNITVRCVMKIRGKRMDYQQTADV